MGGRGIDVGMLLVFSESEAVPEGAFRLLGSVKWAVGKSGLDVGEGGMIGGDLSGVGVGVGVRGGEGGMVGEGGEGGGVSGVGGWGGVG